MVSPNPTDDGQEGDPRARHALGQFVGRDARLRGQLEMLPRIARSGATVLVAGETGTGKELAARAIHYLSSHADGPFVPVNCGALPEDLVENELFGHAAGAYTGAGREAEGLIAEADGGTMFLDEVDSLPAGSQVKLLRFLQEREYRPVGGRKARTADVRVVAATSAELLRRVGEGRFRSDLYYRLNVVTVRLPPLRERRGDIVELAGHFLRKYGGETRAGRCGLSAGVREKLMAHEWPGNVRELENVMQRAVVFAGGRDVCEEDVMLDGDRKPGRLGTFQALKREAIAAFERRYLEGMLAVHHGNITQAARAAGKNRRAFWELLRKHGLHGLGSGRAAEPEAEVTMPGSSVRGV